MKITLLSISNMLSLKIFVLIQKSIQQKYFNEVIYKQIRVNNLYMAVYPYQRNDYFVALKIQSYSCRFSIVLNKVTW